MVAGTCLLLGLLALYLRASARNAPLDRNEILRVRRFADRIRQDQLLPYE